MTKSKLDKAREIDLEILESLVGSAIVYSLKREKSPLYLGVVEKIGLNQIVISHITWNEPSFDRDEVRERRIYGTDQFSEIEQAGISAEEQRKHYRLLVDAYRVK